MHKQQVLMSLGGNSVHKTLYVSIAFIGAEKTNPGADMPERLF